MVTAATVLLLTVVCAAGALAFSFADVPNNTIKLGDDFFDMNSTVMSDPAAAVPIAALLKDGPNKNKAYFKFGGRWYDVFLLTAEQLLNPAYAMTTEQENAISTGSRWYQAGEGIVFVTPQTVTDIAVLADVNLEAGAGFTTDLLPAGADVTLSDGSTYACAVSWDLAAAGFDIYKAGIYNLTGSLILPEGLTNPENKTAALRAIVYLSNIDPNPQTGLNTSPGTTVFELDSAAEFVAVNTALVEEDTCNKISGTASSRLLPLSPSFYTAPDPNGGGDITYGYYSAQTAGSLGGTLQSLENMEFNIYIPVKGQVEFMLANFYTDESHNFFFQEDFGDWELSPGWNKIRRLKEDFVYIDSINSTQSMDLSLKQSAGILTEKELLQQKVEYFNKLRAATSNPGAKPTSLPKLSASGGGSALSTPEAGWDNITSMEFFVVYRVENNPSVNIDRLAYNTAGEAKLLFTFDDAWFDVLTCGKPILDAKGFLATTWANKEASQDPITGVPLEVFMSESDLSAIYTAGWDIGNHTNTHPDDITVLTEEEMRQEYLVNQDWIEDNGWLRGARHVCYPSGSYSQRLIEILQEIGVKSGRTVEYGIQPTPVFNIYKLKCVALGRDTALPENMARVKNEIDRAVGTGSTLFFMLHRVEENPEPDDGGNNYGQLAIATATLTEIVDYVDAYVQQGKLDVVTISQWYEQYMAP